MSVPLLVAGVVAVVTGIIHVILGERYYRRMPAAEQLPETFLGGGAVTIVLLRAISHLWAVSWWSAAALLFIFSDDTLDSAERTTVRVIAATFALYALFILVALRSVALRHPGFFAFLAVAGAAGWETL